MIFRFLYGLVIRIYEQAVRAASFVSPKAKLWVAGRKNWRVRLHEGLKGREYRKTVWFHAASLGEFEQGRPVIEAFRKEYPDYFLLLSFYSPSGFEIRKNYPGADLVCYLPSDTRSNAFDFVQMVRPEIAFFVKYEIWLNYLTELNRFGSKVILFSAVFRKGQIFFQPFGSMFRRILRFFDVIIVQDQSSRTLLENSGFDGNVIVGGDTRFDRVVHLPEKQNPFPEIAKFVNQRQCLVAGSVWPEDMQVIIPVLNRFAGCLSAIIIPHEIHPQAIGEWTRQLEGVVLRYSDYRNSGFKLANPHPDYLFIDNVGMLSSLYGYGQIAYIGGAFGKGLHNILEAATYGLPVIFGNKNYARFSEATALLSMETAKAVGNEDEMEEAITSFTTPPERFSYVSMINRQFVTDRTGATTTVMSAAARLLN